MKINREELIEDLAPKKIVVCAPSALGDMVVAIPVCTALRTKYPDAHITFLSNNPSCEEVLKGHPDIDRVYRTSNFRSRSFFVRWIEIFKTAKKLRGMNLAIILYRDGSSKVCKSQLICCFLARIRVRLGYLSKNKYLCKVFMTHLIDPNPNEKQIPDVEKHQCLLAPIGVTYFEQCPILLVSEEEVVSARNFLLKKGVPKEAEIVVFSPLCSHGTARHWGVERFRELADKIQKENPALFIVVIGNKTHRGVIEKAFDGQGYQVINLAGETTIREMMGIVKLSKCVIAIDSGPMHIAAALQVPLVAIFGSSSNVEMRPYRWGSVVKHVVGCSPCYQKHCPIDHRCMKGVSVDMVYQAFKEEEAKRG